MSIQSNNQDPLNIDGEINGTTPFEACIVPSALEVFIK
jgi:diacylglycerol kinase family enzyme